TGPEDNPQREVILTYIAQEALKNQKNHTVVAETKTFNDSVTIYGYTSLKNLPIITSVVIDEKDFLGAWRKARMKDISFLAIFTIFGSVLAFFALNMAKQIVRVEESESAAILASQAKSEFL